VKVVGVDVAPGIIEAARTRAPEIEFRVGDMRSLTAGFELLETLTRTPYEGVEAETERLYL